MILSMELLPFSRLALLEEKLRDPGSVANIDCLLDTVTALVADCDHDNVKRIKTIEAYTNRCKKRVQDPPLINSLTN